MSQPGNPMPAELAEIIATHRGLFGGFTMTAGAAESTAGASADSAADASAATGQQAQDAAQGAGQQQAATGGQAQGQQAAQSQQAGDNLPEDPAALKQMISELRRENAAKRTAAKAADDDANAKIAAALKALGIETGQEDPVKVAEQAKAERDAEKATARQAQLQLAIYRSAAKAGADADALLDSNTFLTSVKELDPSDAKAVEDAIKAALDTNPKLKAVQAATKSGPEHTGGTGAGGKPTSLEGAIQQHYGA